MEVVTTGTGELAHVDSEELVEKHDLFDRLYAKAVEEKRHLWIGTGAYRLTDVELERRYEEPINFDNEKLITMVVGCYVCERPFDDDLLGRECFGEPVDGA